MNKLIDKLILIFFVLIGSAMIVMVWLLVISMAQTLFG